MKIKILSQKYNPLLKRTEVVFELNHSQEGATIPRLDLRRDLAGILKTKPNLVLVEKVETKTGTMVAIGEANTYETLEQAKLVEPKHIVARNSPPEKPKEPEKSDVKESGEQQANEVVTHEPPKEE